MNQTESLLSLLASLSNNKNKVIALSEQNTHNQTVLYLAATNPLLFPTLLSLYPNNNERLVALGQKNSDGKNVLSAVAELKNPQQLFAIIKIFNTDWQSDPLDNSFWLNHEVLLQLHQLLVNQGVYKWWRSTNPFCKKLNNMLPKLHLLSLINIEIKRIDMIIHSALYDALKCLQTAIIIDLAVKKSVITWYHNYKDLINTPHNSKIALFHPDVPGGARAMFAKLCTELMISDDELSPPPTHLKTCIIA